MLTTKQCTKCATIKPLSEFHTKSSAKDKKCTYCKSCEQLRHRTKRGLIKKIYKSQRHVSKKRGHKQPSYTEDELYEWIVSHSHFDYIFNEWVESNYNRNKVPSIDRIDDYKPYTHENIKLTIWERNHNRFFNDKVNGINNKNSISVQKLNTNNEIIDTYFSEAEAARVNNIDQGSISKCCQGKRKTCGGYMWRYA